ncbi:PREDICTED: uncharacterized protein LOC104821582 [Tarenaya hassleriana]|uniref:uncharacterized protein LOC104821582 n=1 Tax=Tarenaya hassleriana TaxID=28532 RepID=UPI00053C4590|nr:PREDICTED: uncharacterized protein LOC104821582 [Tarenaya hassleriana]
MIPLHVCVCIYILQHKPREAKKLEREMSWLLKERRGPAWKRGWLEQTLLTLSPPPLQLLALFAIISLLLFLSSYPRYKYQVEKTATNLKLFLLFLPMLFVLVVFFISFFHKLVSPSSYYIRTKRGEPVFGIGGEFPWGITVIVILLLVLVSKQSYFHSLWYPTLW